MIGDKTLNQEFITTSFTFVKLDVGKLMTHYSDHNSVVVLQYFCVVFGFCWLNVKKLALFMLSGSML